MRAAISNIAWSPEQAPEIYALLAKLGIHGIEVAPGLLFAGHAKPLDPGEAALAEALRDAGRFGHRFVSMQSLHFGVAGAALFGDDDERSRFLGAIGSAIDLAAALGIGNLVLGSPRNRAYPDGMTAEEALESGAGYLRALGDRAASARVSLAIEPNPARYGTNFVTTLDEAIELAERVAHPAIGVNFDLGERLVNDGAANVAADVLRAGKLIKHVHVSAPDLLPPADLGETLTTLTGALSRVGYDRWVSIEMRSGAGDDAVSVRTVGQGLIHALR